MSKQSEACRGAYLFLRNERRNPVAGLDVLALCDPGSELAISDKPTSVLMLLQTVRKNALACEGMSYRAVRFLSTAAEPSGGIALRVSSVCALTH